MSQLKGINNKIRGALNIGRPKQGRCSYMGLHPQVRDWVSRVYAVNGSIAAHAVAAVDQYVRALERCGAWDKINKGIVIPLATNQFTTCHLPLVAPSGVTPVVSGFAAANYTLTTGLAGASTRYIDLGAGPATLGMTESNLQLSVYSRTNSNPGTFIVELGCNSGTSPTEVGELFLCPRIGGSHNMKAGDNIDFSVTGATSTGLISGIIESAGVNRIVQRGVQVGATNTTVMNTGTLQTRNIFAFAENNFGTAGEFSTRVLSYLYAGPGLTLQEEFAHHLAVQIMQGRLLRAV